VVVVVRNPVSVARSLERRGASSYSFSTQLWLSYYLHIFEHVSSEDYLITHYDTYFANPKEEVHRVLDFIGLETSIETLHTASSLIKQDIRHHSTRLIDLFQRNITIDVIEKYLELCAKAGSIYQPIHAQELSEIGIFLDFGNLESTVDIDDHLALTKTTLRQATLAMKNPVIQAVTTQVLEKAQALQVLNSQMANKEQVIQELTAQVQDYSASVANKEQVIQELTAQVQDYSA